MTPQEEIAALVVRLSGFLAKSGRSPVYSDCGCDGFSIRHEAGCDRREVGTVVTLPSWDADRVVALLPDIIAALPSAPVAASKVKTETPALPADLLAHLRRIPMTEWVWQDAEMIFAALEAAALSHASPVDAGEQNHG